MFTKVLKFEKYFTTSPPVDERDLGTKVLSTRNLTSNMASAGGVRIIESDSRFRSELTGARGTLIIANFKASW